ncbi:hypothetical protein DIZ27_39080 [Streptomyces sp. NWU339]|uniref:hypothetical protein n=1 Tax=Streptomyces sp. NWU339 TaxID=2185284 RepID=UPI000D677B74|nr:hypothetical protein [Streptomyces sp. NWU339]PWI05463.1 hypothetical protein DIZ27_39080 [Streptomyces sp. NWU339]
MRLIVREAASPGGVDGKPSPSVQVPAGAGGGQVADMVTTLTGLPSAEQARKDLAGLTVAAHGPMAG